MKHTTLYFTLSVQVTDKMPIKDYIDYIALTAKQAVRECSEYIVDADVKYGVEMKLHQQGNN